MSTPIPAPRADGFTTTTDVPLYWREDGPPTAPLIVLLHGGPGAQHEYLYPQMLALAKTHRVLTYDQRGGGRSRSTDATPVTWQTQVTDLAAVIRERADATNSDAANADAANADAANADAEHAGGINRSAPILVGYSWGALLAMLYLIVQANDQPDATSRDTPLLPSIDRVLLISPAPITRAWRTVFERDLAERQQSADIRRMRDELASSGLRESDPAAYRQRGFELSVAGYFADPRQAVSLTPFRVTARTQQSVWDSLGEFDLRDALRAVRLPVLVVHGRQDPIPLDNAESVATALAGQLVVLDDCGHVPYVEQPQGLFDAALRFLA